MKLIESGGYSKVFRTDDGYAIKIEDPKMAKQNRLSNEASILKEIQGPGIPEIYEYWTEEGKDMIKMELLGDDIEVLCRKLGGGLGYQSTIMFGIQALERLEYIHSKGVIHRDVKDTNFVIGIKDPSVIYLIDFGLSEVIDKKSLNKHYWECKNFAGNMLFAAKESHSNGSIISKKNDIESLLYLMLYLYQRKKITPMYPCLNNIDSKVFPWGKDFKEERDELHLKLFELKNDFDFIEITSDFPDEFREFMNYIFNLQYYQAPDMKFLKNCLKECLRVKNYELDYSQFDWIKKKKPRVKSKTIKKAPSHSMKLRGPKAKRLAKFEEKRNVKDRLRGRIDPNNLWEL
ncbi:unnamed protein product [Moneuplotes crassus]|uniref:Casein kinase I n=1 Tax=Euplotes crassus TaxID=5936 RepID=A0AAD1XIU6_EUPCR|nr:unnamed protein product [Moneuplotes crassus]